jgi:phenylalanyl-tRNA synthetase beta chain
LKILVSWLRELADVPVPIAQLASDLHLAGFEVASVEPPPGSSSTADDAVIDFEITANRPDCLSVLGLAREVATRYQAALRVPDVVDPGPASPSRADELSVTIDAPDGCARYCGALADVRVGPSPDWMQRRLAAAGIRAINNIVDVTNYVLLEIGQPMHAFDLARIAGHELRVRRAVAGERLTTLDGQERTLSDEVLVIADAARAQALAGIMGGADSEVSGTTQTIALESAWFEPTGVRRTARRLGLSTEASYRFERGADIAAAPLAIARALHLLEGIGAGQGRGGWVDAYPAVRRTLEVRLELDRIEKTLGTAIPAEQSRRILDGLGFSVEESSHLSGAPEKALATSWLVGVPTWRVDVTRDVDLIEEIARHHGYDRLPRSFPALAQLPAADDARLDRDRRARRLAAATGFSESVTFSFIDRRAALAFAGESELVEILNPLSEQFAVLRPSLLPGLLDSVAHNRRHGQEDVQLFELGTSFGVTAGERRALGLAWTGAAQSLHWSGTRRSVDFFDMKGAVQLIASGIGLPVDCVPADHAFLVPGRAASVVVASGQDSRQTVGIVGQLAPALASVRDIPAGSDVYVAELDLDALLRLAAPAGTMTAVPPPRQPSVVRDVSIVVDDTLPASEVRGTIRAAAPGTLVDVREFDRYQGKGVPDGRVSVSYRLTFRAPDRTLTDTEVQQAMDKILRALIAAHAAVQR